MASHAGLEGTVIVGTSGVVAEVREWEIQETGEVADSSSLDNTTGWRTHKATMKSWNGSLTCWWDETDTDGQGAMTIGASVTMKVYPEGNSTGDKYYTGTATITQINRKASFDGIVEASFSFTGNGALTEATAA